MALKENIEHALDGMDGIGYSVVLSRPVFPYPVPGIQKTKIVAYPLEEIMPTRGWGRFSYDTGELNRIFDHIHSYLMGAGIAPEARHMAEAYDNRIVFPSLLYSMEIGTLCVDRELRLDEGVVVPGLDPESYRARSEDRVYSLVNIHVIPGISVAEKLSDFFTICADENPSVRPGFLKDCYKMHR